VIPVFILHQQVDWFYGILMGTGSMVGAWISVKVAIKRGTRFLKVFLYVVIFASALWMLAKNGF
jgi:uncharacterized protein